MHRSTFARGVAFSALLAISAGPAFAEGKADRARAAIQQAQGKVDAATRVGAGGEVPHITAQAQEALATAKEDLSSGHKEAAVADANHAGALADQAIGMSQKMKVEAERARTDDAAAAAQSAAAQAADANARADAAQAQAADANARASSAEQSAAVANAQADAMRNAPTPAAPAPQTTVVVQKEVHSTATASRAPVKKVVRGTTTAPAARSTTETTTATVTTQPPSQ